MSCEICGKTLKPYQARFCGHACRGIWYSGHSADARARPCVVCGATFNTKGKRQTCSKACRYALLRKTFADRGIQPKPQTPEMKAASAKRMTGAGCPKWNGGRTTCGNGRYILVRVSPDWPWPGMVTAQGYIREHRMVLAMKLGRALERREVSHHVNGDTMDNRPENLMLFAGQGDHMRWHKEQRLLGS